MSDKPQGYAHLTAEIAELKTKLAAAQAEIAALKDKDLAKFAPDWANYRVGFDCGFAEAQEQAAKVCEQPIDEVQISDDRSTYLYKDWYDCAAAIRAMKVKK